MSTATFEVVDDDLWQDLVDHKLDFDQFLFLESHDELVRYWTVKGRDPVFQARLADVLPSFGAISVFDWENFAKACAEQGYRPVFMEDPSPIFAWKDSLNEDPGVEIKPTFDGRIDREGNEIHTIRGFLPFQAQGVNYMRSCERATYGQWSTGTGKSVLAEGTILHKMQEGFDLTLYVNKPGNLYNAQRKIQNHVLRDIDSTVLWGTPKVRERILEEFESDAFDNKQPVLILNAEKFKSEKELLKEIVRDRRVLVIFDEMPFKYGNRMTDLYRATAEVFYTSYTTRKGKKSFYPKAGRDRPFVPFYLAMSATSMRNSPEDIFNCVRMMDSRIFGSINDFHNDFVAARDPWGKIVRWSNLDYFGAKYSHIVHLADKKTDPRIAAQFPKVLPPEIVLCDLSDEQQWLYNKLQNEYRKLKASEVSMLDTEEILAALGCLQMIVDNPRAVLESAQRRDAYEGLRHDFMATNPSVKELRVWEKKNRDGSEVALKLRNLVGDDSKFTDERGPNCVISKMNRLREDIEENEEKVIVFSDKNDTVLPYIAEWFDKWGITYVAYHGSMTAKKRDEAQTEFRTNPDIKVFLSTDAGQDSIDLPEANLTCHYNDPWTQATKIQRGSRQHRIDSDMESVREITYRSPNTCEDHRATVLQGKSNLQEEVDGEIVEQSYQMSRGELFSMITGEV